MNEHEQLVDQAARHARSVLFLGGLDAGKSTLARATAAFALRLGRSVAYIDADVAQKTVGPPATVVNCQAIAAGSRIPSAALTVVSSFAV